MATNFRKIEKQLGNSKEFKSRLERKIQYIYSFSAQFGGEIERKFRTDQSF